MVEMSSISDFLLWGTIICLLSSITLHFIRKRRLWSEIIDRIPGPVGHPVLGVAWEFFTQRENLARVMIDMFGPFAKDHPMLRLWLGPIPFILLTRAESAKALLSSHQHIEKGMVYRFLHNWIGDGLLTSTGSKWQQRRKLITPSFHFRILDNFLLVMNEQSNILVQQLQTNCQHIKYGEFDIYPFITRCTLDIICETAMGHGVNAQLNADSQYVNAVSNLGKVNACRMTRPWLYSDWTFPLSSLGRMERRSLKIVHGFTNKMIRMRRMKLFEKNVANGHVDHSVDAALGMKRRVALLDMLLENSIDNTNDNRQQLTDEDIREEVDTFMFEGHDTTSVGISWAIYCIGQHPEVQQKIADELNAVFGNDDRDISSEDLNHLKYLECVIKESMRLFPPVPIYSRRLTEDAIICGYKIPPGVDVVFATYFIHRDPTYYPEPETFNPDRFLPDNSQDRDPYAYVPFSAGQRNCIGQRFALMEMKVVLSRILRNFILTTVVESDVISNMVSELVLRPIRGIRVKLEPRYM